MASGSSSCAVPIVSIFPVPEKAALATLLRPQEAICGAFPARWSKRPQQYESSFVARFCGGLRQREKITSLEVASIAFVWSAATPLSDFRTISGQKPGPTSSTIWRKQHEKRY